MITAALILQGPANFKADGLVAGMLPLQRLILTFKQAGIKRVVIAGDVIMREAELHATRLGAEFIYPTRLKRRFVSHYVNAAEHLADKCGRVLAVPANFPLFDVNTVERLLETEAETAVPVYKGVWGCPVLIPAKYLREIAEAEGDIYRVLKEHPPVEIEVDDAGVTADVTQDIDADAIAETLTLRAQIRPSSKLTIGHERVFYGPGIQQMVRLVEETGSILKAQKLLGMAYSYAIRIVREAEAGLGFRLFDYETKGQKRSTLTEECKAFADKYDAFTADCEEYMEEAFRKYFG
ncbi:MAG: NTP transferase domain-containing protein [Oscillospiraceae bacterium]|jgi:molybdenum-dependent DNA-binding transcriptional regulator ModE/CTP:molybdopterin cytidylyltransferase MocA|nr:NTP transferase domain-containing protein [Oscillospiraceae bacterium]